MWRKQRWSPLLALLQLAAMQQRAALRRQPQQPAAVLRVLLLQGAWQLSTTPDKEARRVQWIRKTGRMWQMHRQQTAQSHQRNSSSSSSGKPLLLEAGGASCVSGSLSRLHMMLASCSSSSSEEHRGMLTSFHTTTTSSSRQLPLRSCPSRLMLCMVNGERLVSQAEGVRPGGSQAVGYSLVLCIATVACSSWCSVVHTASVSNGGLC